MGAGQSSGGGGAAAAASQEVKTSYYDLLGVARQATEEEIKKAYRRKALELHPDRNFGDEEAATKTFAEVQAAYEVLSDPQERAWYDSHESAILRGDDPADGAAPSYDDVKITTADDLARLVRKFNSNVEFSDSPSGFFGFVRDTFDQLAKEEEAAANWENVEANEYPTFGHKDDDYSDVVKQFYAAWASFATVKSFSWTDKYRLSEAPDRWYRRRMEQENARIRQDAKREFNDAVRSLVAFIRKRDPRYIPNTQSEQERQQTLREAAIAQANRARAANAAKLNDDIPEWTKVREPDEMEGSLEEEEEEEPLEVLECVACNKIFKSEKQWEAHEKSKKHQKALRALQHKMRKENLNLDLEDEGLDPDADYVLEEGDEIHDGKAEDELLEGENGALDVETEISPKEKAQGKGDALDHETDSADEDYASLEIIQARMKAAILEDSDEGGSQSSKPKMGKAAQKRAKKAAASAAAQKVESTNQCEVCNETFASRSTLFKHIKDEGHAALKSVANGG
ncbi:DnaJ-domain-containing protein, partial [Dissoconium aciculare CBS 342.82]|uniref:DnaJ-domain-containing protein n=1 Tax=Dissoconium aciculare CBS 342.82 TaxID=1314786 RepID=A0A6J3MAD5_9PEZI